MHSGARGRWLGVMGYQAMLERIDKMHLNPEKEDIWQVRLHHRLPAIALDCEACRLKIKSRK